MRRCDRITLSSEPTMSPGKMAVSISSRTAGLARLCVENKKREACIRCWTILLPHNPSDKFKINQWMDFGSRFLLYVRKKVFKAKIIEKRMIVPVCIEFPYVIIQALVEYLVRRFTKKT